MNVGLLASNDATHVSLAKFSLIAQTTCLVERGVLVLVERNDLAVDAGVLIALREGVLLLRAYGLFAVFFFDAIEAKVKPSASSSAAVGGEGGVASPLFDASWVQPVGLGSASINLLSLALLLLLLLFSSSAAAVEARGNERTPIRCSFLAVLSFFLPPVAVVSLCSSSEER